MLADLTLSDLLDRTASPEPLPGGGCIAALVGAAAAALAQMVAGLTAGRTRFATATPAMEALAARARELRQALLDDIDRDAAAYAAILAAYRLPKTAPVDAARRTAAIQTATRAATLVPLEVAGRALDALRLAGEAVRLGNPNARADGAVGALLARAAVRGALLNARINLRDLRDPRFVADAAARADDMDTRARQLEEEIFRHLRV
jgi:formiminotetrahydrofolate cyclodeaminase